MPRSLPNLALHFQLITARCLLRAPSQADIPHIFSATRVPGFNDGMLWEPPTSEGELQAPLEQNLEAWKTGHAFTFTIETQKDSTFVGRITIRPASGISVWDIGFWLHPNQEGKGFMTEAARAIVDFGFEKLGADAIEACHATWNIRSRRVLERIGMREVEYLAQGFQKQGKWVPEFLMRVNKPLSTVWIRGNNAEMQAALF